MKLQLVKGIKITEGRKLHLRMFIIEDTKVMRVSLYYKTTTYIITRAFVLFSREATEDVIY